MADIFDAMSGIDGYNNNNNGSKVTSKTSTLKRKTTTSVANLQYNIVEEMKDDGI
jgi:hypothetical protein